MTGYTEFLKNKAPSIQTSGLDLSTIKLSQMGPDRLAKIFTQWSLENVYDYETHIQIGEALEARGSLPATFMSIAPGSNHPEIWQDINRMITSNSLQAQKGKQLHVCPLQWDIVDRLIERYSNPGDVIFDPFGGLGTVSLRAVKAGRLGKHVELNAGYYADGIQYLKAQDDKMNTPGLFDLIDLLTEESEDFQGVEA